MPDGWFLAARLRDLRRRPQAVWLLGREYAVFLGAGGEPSVLDGRCVHMGARLAKGCVIDGALQCPFHGWRFGPDGVCRSIPAGDAIPDFARQRAYPTQTVGDLVFFSPGQTPAWDVPFFELKDPSRMLGSRTIEFDLAVPWYMVAANGFDIQHFRAAHDRTLIGEPIVTAPDEHSRQITARFAVTGTGWRDRLTRAASGPDVTMQIRSYRGLIVLVTARFRRTTSYGMTSILPQGPTRTIVRTIVWVDASASAITRRFADPIHAAVRRSFIRAFMKSDADRCHGLRYNPGTFIEADRVQAEYLRWVLEDHR